MTAALEQREYELLKQIEREWSGGNDLEKLCVVCSGDQPNHQPGCELAAILHDRYMLEIRAESDSIKIP